MSMSSFKIVLINSSTIPRRLIPSVKPRALLQVHVRDVSTKSSESPYFRPSQSDIVRFLLKEATQRGQDSKLTSEIDNHLRGVFLTNSPSDNLDRQLFDLLGQNKELDPEVVVKILGRVQSLGELQRFIESNVDGLRSSEVLQINNCSPLVQSFKRSEQFSSYREILSVLNGIIARLDRLGALVSPKLYVLGMQYACRCFSAPALIHHLKGYRAVKNEPSRLSRDTSVTLVKALLSSLQTIQFESPNYDPRPMVNAVFGEGIGDEEAAPRLHDVMYWCDESKASLIGLYILILAKLDNGNRTLLDPLWRRFLETSFRSPSPGSLQIAYSCLLAMYCPTRPGKVSYLLQKMSMLANNTLPGISRSRDLISLVAVDEIRKAIAAYAGEKEFTKVLESYLEYAERRLGLQWQSENSVHSSGSDPFHIATDQPLLTVDGENVGFDSRERLIAEIRALGCSKSAATLGIVADLLNEHEGSEIAVSIPNCENLSIELAWIPQLSPVEFSDSRIPERYDASVPWSSSALGLIRARPHFNRAPRTAERSLHLMQLGYLVMRAVPSAEQSEESRQWKETGHIVAWDRIGQSFFIVFVGKSRGVVDSGLHPDFLQPPTGLNVIQKIAFPEKEIAPSTLGFLEDYSPANNVRRYNFEVDPTALAP